MGGVVLWAATVLVRARRTPNPDVPRGTWQPEPMASPFAPEPLWRDLVGEQLRCRRRALGDTLQDVAQRAGVSPQYLSEIERGRKEPSSEMLAAVAGALEVTLLDLTSGAAERLRGRLRDNLVDGAARVSVQSAFALAA